METCYVYLSTPDTWYEIFVIRELQHEDGCMAGDQWRLPLHLIINKDPFSIYLITKSYDSDPDEDSDEDKSDQTCLQKWMMHWFCAAEDIGTRKYRNVSQEWYYNYDHVNVDEINVELFLSHWRQSMWKWKFKDKDVVDSASLKKHSTRSHNELERTHSSEAAMPP